MQSLLVPCHRPKKRKLEGVRDAPQSGSNLGLWPMAPDPLPDLLEEREVQPHRKRKPEVTWVKICLAAEASRSSPMAG